MSLPQPAPKTGSARKTSMPANHAPVRSEFSSCELRPALATPGSAAKRTSANSGQATTATRAIAATVQPRPSSAREGQHGQPRDEGNQCPPRESEQHRQRDEARHHGGDQLEPQRIDDYRAGNGEGAGCREIGTEVVGVDERPRHAIHRCAAEQLAPTHQPAKHALGIDRLGDRHGGSEDSRGEQCNQDEVWRPAPEHQTRNDERKDSGCHLGERSRNLAAPRAHWTVYPPCNEAGYDVDQEGADEHDHHGWPTHAWPVDGQTED